MTEVDLFYENAAAQLRGPRRHLLESDYLVLFEPLFADSSVRSILETAGFRVLGRFFDSLTPVSERRGNFLYLLARRAQA